MNADRLRQLLEYDPVTGVFRWRERVAQCVHVGQVAGYSHPSGYRFIKLDGVSYPEHRLAFLHVTGLWPADQVDHRDGQRDHNAFGNLRECTGGQNAQNAAVYRSNTSGQPGVSWHKASRRWRARIDVEGRQRHLGLFATREEAGAAYLAAKRDLHDFQPVPRA